MKLFKKSKPNEPITIEPYSSFQIKFEIEPPIWIFERYKAKDVDTCPPDYTNLEIIESEYSIYGLLYDHGSGRRGIMRIEKCKYKDGKIYVIDTRAIIPDDTIGHYIYNNYLEEAKKSFKKEAEEFGYNGTEEESLQTFLTFFNPRAIDQNAEYFTNRENKIEVSIHYKITK